MTTTRAPGGRFAKGSKHLVKHGLSKSKIYGVWSSMRSRCLNPHDSAFENYGGRGITICDRWSDFANFLRDMGEPPSGLSLDRIDNDLGYSPSNCRWADRKTQNANRRNRYLLTVNGVEKPLAEWAREAGLKTLTLYKRLEAGWSGERAVTEPVRKSSRWHGDTHGVPWTPEQKEAA